MKEYLDVLRDVMQNGATSGSRAGGTRRVFRRTMRFNLRNGFPAVTTKQLFFSSVVKELLWFLQMRDRADNTKLQEMGCEIWTANANAWQPKAQFEGDLGRIYGVQWRSWMKPNGETIDQLNNVIELIKANPEDRRLLVSAWNPGEIDDMALPPCHISFQFFAQSGKLSMNMYQRSCDMFLGVPFNTASYALLLSMVAHITNHTPYEFVHDLGDVHVYRNHIEQVQTQLRRQPLKLPKLKPFRSDIKTIDDFELNDFELVEYNHHPRIRAVMAV